MTPRINTKLALETPRRQADGLGGYTTDWQQLGLLWAQMEARSGREQGNGTGMVSIVQWRITTRAAAAGDARRPRPGQRFRLGQRLFAIEAVAETDATGRLLDCFAREEEMT